MEITLRELAERLGAEYAGDGDLLIRGVAALEDAGPDRLTFAASERYIRKLAESRAGAAIVGSDPGIEGLNLILCDQPQLAFIQVVRLFHPDDTVFQGISPLAAVSDTAVVKEPTDIGPFVTVGPDAVVGARCRIGPSVTIGAGVTVGEDCQIHPNVVLYPGVTIGRRTIIHSGSVIGADGFGFVSRDGVNHKIPQVGSVRIGDDVEIGACVCIDRGTLGDTVIGNGVKIDNLVQVAHNVKVGDGTILVSQVGISGSSTIGRNCVLAGRSGMKDHIEIGDGAVLAANSVAINDVQPGKVVAGFPAHDIETWRRSTVILRNLPKYWPKILKLLKNLDEK